MAPFIGGNESPFYLAEMPKEAVQIILGCGCVQRTTHLARLGAVPRATDALNHQIHGMHTQTGVVFCVVNWSFGGNDTRLKSTRSFKTITRGISIRIQSGNVVEHDIGNAFTNGRLVGGIGLPES